MKQWFLVLFGCIFCSFPLCSMNIQEVEVVYAPPAAEEFVALRAAAGMRARSVASAEKGIPNSLFWVTLRSHGKLIGMGRVVGDGGTVVQITDIAVDPEQQGKGYGTFIFDRIREFILAEIPDDAFVCLFAEHKIAPFYQARGFEFSQEKWPGMYWPCLDRKKSPKIGQQPLRERSKPAIEKEGNTKAD
jgi:GNAT superfamily N-acetyltransferase